MGGRFEHPNPLGMPLTPPKSILLIRRPSNIHTFQKNSCCNLEGKVEVAGGLLKANFELFHERCEITVISMQHLPATVLGHVQMHSSQLLLPYSQLRTSVYTGEEHATLHTAGLHTQCACVSVQPTTRCGNVLHIQTVSGSNIGREFRFSRNVSTVCPYLGITDNTGTQKVQKLRKAAVSRYPGITDIIQGQKRYGD